MRRYLDLLYFFHGASWVMTLPLSRLPVIEAAALDMAEDIRAAQGG